MTQYYTKEKLGENNTRIQPYMTESAYSQELISQNDAMNQVYKDYILDYHFNTSLEEHRDIHRSKHIRNLPKGQSASPEKIRTAEENGFILKDGQTWVDDY